MEFFEAVARRRSVRNYSSKSVPPEIVQKAIDAALIAPNSSNMQTWQIYWVRTPEKKAKLVEACMNQGAARTAQELVVFMVDPSQWKRTRDLILEASGGAQAPKQLRDYYLKLMPALYGYKWAAPLKWVAFNAMGFTRPMPREVATARDIREVSVKSCALACENFMLAIAAQGFDTCPMEGFDSSRVKKIVGAPRGSTAVMVISVGERTEEGIWGPRYRIPRDLVVHEV